MYLKLSNDNNKLIKYDRILLWFAAARIFDGYLTLCDSELPTRGRSPSTKLKIVTVLLGGGTVVVIASTLALVHQIAFTLNSTEQQTG